MQNVNIHNDMQNRFMQDVSANKWFTKILCKCFVSFYMHIRFAINLSFVGKKQRSMCSCEEIQCSQTKDR